MINAKIHRTGPEMILAACDSELSGKILEEDDIRIAVDIGFFGKEQVTEDEYRGMLAGATSANIVGERAVSIAIEEKCVLPDAVAHVSGVPYAMFFSTG